MYERKIHLDLTLFLFAWQSKQRSLLEFVQKTLPHPAQVIFLIRSSFGEASRRRSCKFCVQVQFFCASFLDVSFNLGRLTINSI